MSIVKRMRVREKWLLGAALCAVCIAAAKIFFLDAAIIEYHAIEKKIQSTRARISSYQSFQRNPAAQYAYTNLPLFIASRADSSNVLSLVLKDIESRSQAAGLRITSLRPLPDSKKNRAALIQLRQEGTLEAVVAFMYSLEASCFWEIKKCTVSITTHGNTAIESTLIAFHG